MQLTKKIHRTAAIALCLYLICLFWIVILKCNLRQGVLESRQFMAEKEIWERIVFSLGKFAESERFDTVINIFIFIPIGLLLPILIKDGACFKSAMIGIATTFLVEMTQLLVPIGGFTYIDIINNSLGAFLGVIIHYQLNQRVKEDRAVTLINSMSVIEACVVIFGIINTIRNIDIYLVSF